MDNLYSKNAVIVILLLVGQISARIRKYELDTPIKALYNVCSEKYSITDEIKANAMNGILSEDRNFKCYVMCLFDTFSLINAEGVIDGQLWISKSPEIQIDIVTKVVTKCLPSDAGKPDSCEAAFSFLSCGIKAEPDLVDLVVA